MISSVFFSGNTQDGWSLQFTFTVKEITSYHDDNNNTRVKYQGWGEKKEQFNMGLHNTTQLKKKT